MNFHVFLHALRSAGRTTAALCLATCLFFFVVFGSSSAFVAQAMSDVPMLRDPPRPIRALLGGSADFFHPAGWLVSGMNHPITLALFAAAALSVPASGIAGEVERGTIDFVLSRPVGRGRYLVAVAAASMLVVTLVELSGFLTTLLARQLVGGVNQLPIAGVARVFIGSWTVFAAFAAVALLISANVRLRGRAVALAVGFLVFSFFANFVGLMLDELDALRVVSIFHYYRAASLLAGSASLADLLVPVGFGAVAIAVALVSFSRRDISR